MGNQVLNPDYLLFQVHYKDHPTAAWQISGRLTLKRTAADSLARNRGRPSFYVNSIDDAELT